MKSSKSFVANANGQDAQSSAKVFVVNPSTKNVSKLTIKALTQNSLQLNWMNSAQVTSNGRK